MKKALISIALGLFASGFAFGQAADSLIIDIEKEDIYLTVPESCLGRRILLSTIVTGSDSPYMPLHRDVSQSQVFTVSRVDSSLVFELACAENAYCMDADGAIARAIGNSHTGAVEYLLKVDEPVGGNAYRVKATEIFNPAHEAVVDLEDIPYSSYAIKSASYCSEKSAILGSENSGDAVSVLRELSFDLKLRTMGLVFELDDKYPVTFQAATSLTLLPENTMEHKLADKRIGTYNVAATEFSSTKGSAQKNWVRRWDLSKGICIHVDTLLSPAQKNAVYEAFEQWNKAFSSIGLGAPINVVDYTADFDADAPLESIVTFSGAESSMSANLVLDGTDRILAAKFYIPSEYVSSVRKRSAFTIAWTDPRYQSYELCEDAICEVLKADFIRTMGLCLGIAPNLAASYACTPAQLRDSAFVASHGITASVTDNVLFNYHATPSDRMNGVGTIVDRAGEYDVYALDYIYGAGKPDNAPEHFYCATSKKVADYRVRRYDLTNDSEADFKAGLAQIQYVADNGEAWIADAPDEYRMLFLDWLWLRGNNMLYLLASNVGGYAYNAPYGGSSAPKYIALPASAQRKALRQAFDYMRDFGWLDSSSLVKIAGANPNVSDFSRQNAFKMVNSAYWFQHVAFACAYAGSEYSVKAYLKDLEKYSFQNLVKGRILNGETMIVGQYIAFLASNAAAGGSDKVQGMSEISYEYLLRALKLLGKCRNKCSSEQDKLLIDYMIKFTEDKINFK